MSISDQLRQRIQDSGMSMFDIAKKAKINPSVLTRFISHGQGITAYSLDKIAEALELELVKKIQAPVAFGYTVE